MSYNDPKKDSIFNVSVHLVNSYDDDTSILGANLERLLQEPMLIIGQSMVQIGNFEVRDIYNVNGNSIGLFKWSTGEVVIEDNDNCILLRIDSQAPTPKSMFQTLKSHFKKPADLSELQIPIMVPSNDSQPLPKCSIEGDSALFIINFNNFGIDLTLDKRSSVFKTVVTLYFNYYFKNQ